MPPTRASHTALVTGASRGIGKAIALALAKIVQRVAAQLPWRQNIALLQRLDDEKTRLWYARQNRPQDASRFR